jgi:putative redox protein
MNTVKVWHESGKFKQEVLSGTHHFLSDVGVGEGGEDAGPSPHDFLTTALATCTAITLRMYAGRKGWPLDHLEVVVSFSKVGEVSRFDRQITFGDGLDVDQKKRLLEIADRCPVHLALTGKIEVQTVHFDPKL